MLFRAWCLYEISCSTKISIAISQTQRDAFYDTLRNSQEAIMTALCNINLENATAWMKEDQERIFEVLVLFLLLLSLFLVLVVLSYMYGDIL